MCCASGRNPRACTASVKWQDGLVIGKKMFAVEHGGKDIGLLGSEKYDEEKLSEFSGSGLVLLRPGISPTIRRLGECRKNAVPFLCLF